MKSFKRFIWILPVLLGCFLIFWFISPNERTEYAPSHKFVFLATSMEEFWQTVAKGIKSADKEYGSDTLLVYCKEENRILDYLQDALETGAEGIIMQGSEDAEAAVEEAAQSGVPVIFFNMEVENSSRFCYIGFDHYQLGVQAAKLLEAQLEGEGEYALIVYVNEGAVMGQRVLGVTDTLRVQEKMRLVNIIEDRGDPLLLKEKLAQCMEEHPNLRGIISFEGIAADNMGEIISESGWQLHVIATDFTARSAKYLQDGVYDSIIWMDTAQIGKEAVRILNEVSESNSGENKTQITDSVILSGVEVTRDNLKQNEVNFDYGELNWNEY